jgi:phage shock protein A
MSFGQKLRLVVLGNINDLLDKTIDLNSPAALRQYVRDLEDATARMRDEATKQDGQLRILRREASDLQSVIETAKAITQKILAGNDANKTAIATAKASEIVGMQTRLAEKQDAIKTQEATSAKLDAAVASLDHKHSEILSRVRELERMDRDSKAKEAAATAVQAANKLVSGGADISVDDVQQRMRDRNDQASAKFDRAMNDGVGGTFPQPDPTLKAAVDDLLKELSPKEEVHA